MNREADSDYQALYPRDGEALTTTRDYDLLLTLLSGYRTGWKYFTSFYDSMTNSSFSLGETIAGRLVDPITGEPVDQADEWIPTERNRCRKVAQHFFDSFYGLRKILRLDSLPNETIHVDGMAIFRDGKPCRTRDAMFSWRLRYPMSWDHDPLFDPPANYFQRVAKASASTRIEDREHADFCPLHGVVTPIEIDVAKPIRTWEGLCGRQWTYSVCPQCLFQFRSMLTLMN